MSKPEIWELNPFSPTSPDYTDWADSKSIARDLEMAQLYMDRGLGPALDRVARNLNTTTKQKWNRRRVLMYLALHFK